DLPSVYVVASCSKIGSVAVCASVFVFQIYRDPLSLHSCPTRRSSDLAGLVEAIGRVVGGDRLQIAERQRLPQRLLVRRAARRRRSEEHTSELQSHLNLVCRLLLEKKKTGSIGVQHSLTHVVVMIETEA